MLSVTEIEKMQALLRQHCEEVGVHALEAVVQALGHKDGRQTSFGAMMLCLYAGKNIAKEAGMMELFRTMCHDVVMEGRQRNPALEN